MPCAHVQKWREAGSLGEQESDLVSLAPAGPPVPATKHALPAHRPHGPLRHGLMRIDGSAIVEWSEICQNRCDARGAFPALGSSPIHLWVVIYSKNSKIVQHSKTVPIW